MTQTVKIGRNVYELEKGDYFLDNGACIQYFPKTNKLKKSYQGLSGLQRFNAPTKRYPSQAEWKRLKRDIEFKVVVKREHELPLTYYYYDV